MNIDYVTALIVLVVPVLLQLFKLIKLDVTKLPPWAQWAPGFFAAFAAGLVQSLQAGKDLVTALIDSILVGLAAIGVYHGGKRLLGGGGKLPSALTLLVFLGAGCALPGCAASFEEARLVSAPKQKAATPRPERCVELSDRRVTWGAVGLGATVLAGPTGLMAIPGEDQTMKTGLAIGAASLAAIGASSMFVSTAAGDSWVEEGCGL